MDAAAYLIIKSAGKTLCICARYFLVMPVAVTAFSGTDSASAQQYADVELNFSETGGQEYPGIVWGCEVPPGGILLGQAGSTESNALPRRSDIPWYYRANGYEMPQGFYPFCHVNIPWSYQLSKYEITCGQYCGFLNAALSANLIERETPAATDAGRGTGWFRSARREGSFAIFSKSGSGLLKKLDGNHRLIAIGDSWYIRWNAGNFEVVDNMENHPVAVTWYGALAFAHFYGYDLPTEAEWEKAARGPGHGDVGSSLPYPWGNSITPGHAAYGGNVKPVGYYDGDQVPAGPDTGNGYDLYDVVGNHGEWTRTLAGLSAYPPEESLFYAHNNVALRGLRVVKGLSKDGVHVRRFRLETSDHYFSREYMLGFRICRRNDEGRRTLIREVFDDLENGPVYAGSGDRKHPTSLGRSWETDGTIWLAGDPADAASGSKYMAGLRDNGGFSIYPPGTDNPLCEIHLKIKNTHSSSGSIRLYSGLGGNPYSVDIPPDSGWRDIVLYVLCHRIGRPESADGRRFYWINVDAHLSIDDIELWTIPIQ